MPRPVKTVPRPCVCGRMIKQKYLNECTYCHNRLKREKRERKALFKQLFNALQV